MLNFSISNNNISFESKKLRMSEKQSNKLSEQYLMRAESDLAYSSMLKQNPKK